MQPSGNSVRHNGTGWSSALSRAAAAILLFELISGLAITFGPFNPSTQWGLLVHTVVGVLTVALLVWYVVRHWQTYSDQALSDVLLLGYVAAGALGICLISGLLVTAQALWTTKTSPALRYVHLVSTLLVVAATVPHLVLGWWRRRRSIPAREPAGWISVALTFTGAAVIFVAACALTYSGTRYENRFPADYSFAYGSNRPFAPSLAHTSTNGAFDARSLAGSETCGESGCHTQIYNEWKTSAHRYAAMDPIFQGIQTVMAKQNGPESTRYCGGCHDPISLFSGTKNIFTTKLTTLQGYNEGISCLACHAIQKTDIQGNANYTVAQPREYLWQWSADHSASAVARNFLIRSWPAQHNRLNRRMYKTPEYCAACHKQFIDQEVNRVGWVQLQNQYDNWAASHWNHKGDARSTVECRECHMPLAASSDPAAGDSLDYNRSPDDHRHRSHRFLAANSFVPALLRLDGAAQHVQLTQDWLQGRIEIPEIHSKWAEGPVVKVRIDAPESVAPGASMPVRVILTSNKVGHDYPTGPLDMIQSWVELRVRDSVGRTVFTSGQLDTRNFIVPGTFLFKAEPVDQYGNLIDRHNLWEMVGVRYRRSLFPGYSDTVEYNIACPAGLSKPTPKMVARNFSVPTGDNPGKLQIEAILHYRKIDQFLLNYVVGQNSGLTAPVVDIARARTEVCVARAEGSPSCR
ncbi:MAG TPA: multiheme c-type cytochrome [Acidobacteriaceae bacterium]|nr:multiheme c-type cytochrome [Acidobacteriaceae bacterium]